MKKMAYMISIIIPAYNEARYIKNTLSQLEKCCGNCDEVEVIVVNNCSQDETRQYVEKFSWVKLIDLPSSVTVAKARNIGVSMSAGDCLAFIDADILVSEDWWVALTDFYAHHIHELVISGFKVSVSMNPSWIESNWFSCFKKAPSSYINSGNLICSRKTFDLIGGFDSNLRTGEDVDFCRRASNHGIEIRANGNFKVFHEGYPKTLKEFFMREKWHGTGDLQSLSKFLKSKVALSAFFITFSSLFGVMAILAGLVDLGALLMAFVVIGNCLTLIIRLRIRSPLQFVRIFFLNYIYLVARSFSVLNLLRNDSRSR